MKRIATADTTRTLIAATTAALSFSLYTAAPDGEYAAGDAALSLTAEGLCRYAVGGTAETDVPLGNPSTLSSLCCRDIAGMAPGAAYTALVHADPAMSLCLSCGYEQDEKTEFAADGSLLCTFVPGEGVGAFDLVLYADGRKVMLVRLTFSLPVLPEQERPRLCRAASDATRRAVTQLLGARRTHPHADDPLSAELLAGLAEEVFASVERAAQSRTEGGLRRLFPTLLTYPDAPPFDLLKFFLFETDRRLSLLTGAAQIRERELLLSAERKAARLLSGRFRRVRVAAVTDPFLEAVAAGADVTQAEGAYLAFCRGADACLHLGFASAALARADAARTELQMAGLLCPGGALPPQAAETFLPEPYRTATLSAPPGILHLAAPLPADDPTAFETAGGVVSFAAFLRESILPAIQEADRAALGAGKEAQTDGVNWEEPDMLVGSLGSPGQLAANLRGRFYYAPIRSLPAKMPSVRYVAIYQSRRSEEPGIRYFGRVAKTLVLPRRDIPYPLHQNNPEEPYYYFEVERWLKAKRPVFVREDGVYAPRFTWLFLFLHARESFELFHVRSEADFRLMQTLRRMAEQPNTHPAERESISLPLGRDLYLESGGTHITLYMADEPRLRVARTEFVRAPLRVFTQFRQAVRAAEQTPAASAQAHAKDERGTATSSQSIGRSAETAEPQNRSQR